MAKKPDPSEPTPAQATGLTPAQPADSLPEPAAVSVPQPPEDSLPSNSAAAATEPAAVEQAEATPADDEFLRQATIVICPYHKLRCVANGTAGLITKYYCPKKDEGCTYSAHVPRPKLRDYLLGGRRDPEDNLPHPR